MSKEDLMQELLNRYEQLRAMEQCKSARITVELYIRKLELKLKELL